MGQIETSGLRTTYGPRARVWTYLFQKDVPLGELYGRSTDASNSNSISTSTDRPQTEDIVRNRDQRYF